MSELKSLYSALKGWYCKPLAELPNDLRAWVEQVFIRDWDNCTPAERVGRAREFDFAQSNMDSIDYWSRQHIKAELQAEKNVHQQKAMNAQTGDADSAIVTQAKDKSDAKLRKQTGAQAEDTPKSNNKKSEHHIHDFMRTVKIRAEAEKKPLDFKDMPGIKADLYELWQAMYPGKHQSKSTFNDWLKQHGYKCHKGSRRSGFYRELFPIHFRNNK